jgi:hypothetical protein
VASNLPVPIKSSGVASAREIAERAAGYAAQSQSENTQLAYESDWRIFQDWCARHGAQALPATASTVAGFLVDTAGTVSVSTQRRRLSAIKDMQRREGHHLDLSTGAFQDI